MDDELDPLVAEQDELDTAAGKKPEDSDPELADDSLGTDDPDADEDDEEEAEEGY